MQVPSRPSQPASTSMTPLIDVVFLLIIFFLVSSHLSRRENHLPVDLPRATSGSLDPLQTERLVITLDDSGRTLLRGDVVNGDELATELRRHAANAAKWGAGGAVRVRCDDRLSYDRVAPVLRTIATSGCTDFVIAVRDRATQSRARSADGFRKASVDLSSPTGGQR